MQTLNAQEMDFQALNRQLNANTEDVTIENCFGERFIGTGLSKKRILVHGTPGNALGAYMDGATIEVHGNAQDAVGDTMNEGKIIIHGNAGDALGYAMRGGKIFVRGNAGYRTGIHMKQYGEKCPVIIVGGKAGSFLGEYLAGGLIIVLGQACDGFPVGNFPGVGMHGGKIFICADELPKHLPEQVQASFADAQELASITPLLHEYALDFNQNVTQLLSKRFLLLTPNAKNPYKKLYTPN